MLRRLVFVYVMACASLGLFVAGASAETCPNEQLRREDNSLALPECRAYEMVTPAEKFGGNEEPGATIVDDSHLFTTMIGPAQEDAVANGIAVTYLATRDSGGWAFAAQIAGVGPAFLDQGTQPLDFSPDLNRMVYVGKSQLVPADTDLSPDVYVRTAAGYELASTGSLGNGSAEAAYVGSSTDLSHVLFTTTDVLDGSQPGSGLYDHVEGQTELVGVGTLGEPLVGTTLGSGRSSGGNAYAVSADGSHIYFESSNKQHLYVRIDGTSTVEVSLPQRTAPGNALTTVTFNGASADGSKVFFTTTRELTEDDTSTTASTDADLYEYDLGTGHLKRITGGPEGTIQTATEKGVIALTADASRVYFVARGVLAPGAVSNMANIYLYEAATDTISLVATLPTADEGILLPHGTDFTSEAQMTPDGGTLVFESAGALTSFNNAGVEEVYRYRPSTGVVDCISCNTTGSIPLGPAAMPREGGFFGSILATKASRLVSDDGSTILFQTTDALAPQDTDGLADVYLWHDGAVSLISSGKDGSASEAVGLSPDGTNAFFTTYQQLLPQDFDHARDLYDARVDGGFPQPPAPPEHCADDACQGTPTNPPILPSVGSAVFSGSAPIPPAAPAAAKAVLTTRKAVQGSSVSIRVTVPAAGSIVASGSGVRTTKRSVGARGTYTLKVPLAAATEKRAKRKQTKRKRALKLRITVRFHSTNGMSSTATVSATVKA